MDEPRRIRGKITMTHEKGYGFIISEEMKFIKFFFHWTALNQDTLRFPELKTGMEVEFTPYMNDTPNPDKPDRVQGPRAIKINVI